MLQLDSKNTSDKLKLPDGQKYANIDTIMSDQGMHKKNSNSLDSEFQNNPSGFMYDPNKKSYTLISPNTESKNQDLSD